MTYNFTVSPDFNPKHLSGWFIFNTWLQRAIGIGLHLELYNDYSSQRQAIADDRFDLIYANPYDASVLVRQKGFVPLACAEGKADEAIIAVRADYPAQRVEDLQPGVRIATTEDADVNMICMIMLEPADLNASNIEIKQCESFVLVAKRLIKGEADAGFFLEETYHDLSDVIGQELRPIAQSQIQVINHVLLLGPRLLERREDVLSQLLAMNDDEKGRSVLQGLGFRAWAAVEREDTEFMFDLIDALGR